MAPPNPRMINLKRLINEISQAPKENEESQFEKENLPKRMIPAQKTPNINTICHPLKLRERPVRRSQRKSSHSSLDSQKGDYSPASDDDREYKPLEESTGSQSEESGPCPKRKKLLKKKKSQAHGSSIPSNRSASAGTYSRHHSSSSDSEPEYSTQNKSHSANRTSTTLNNAGSADNYLPLSSSSSSTSSSKPDPETTKTNKTTLNPLPFNKAGQTATHSPHRSSSSSCTSSSDTEPEREEALKKQSTLNHASSTIVNKTVSTDAHSSHSGSSSSSSSDTESDPENTKTNKSTLEPSLSLPFDKAVLTAVHSSKSKSSSSSSSTSSSDAEPECEAESNIQSALIHRSSVNLNKTVSADAHSSHSGSSSSSRSDTEPENTSSKVVLFCNRKIVESYSSGFSTPKGTVSGEKFSYDNNPLSPALQKISNDLDLSSTSEEDNIVNDIIRPQSTQFTANGNQIDTNEVHQENKSSSCHDDLQSRPLPLKEIVIGYLNRMLSAEENSSIPNETVKKIGRGNKKELAKKLRNLGLAYTSASSNKKNISPRELKEPCNDKCRLKCSEKISHESRLSIFKDYWNMGSLIRQRDYIAKHMTEIKPKYQYKRLDNNRLAKHGFYLTVNNVKQRVCKIFFKNTLGINDRPIRTVIQKLNESGILKPEKRGKHENHGTKIADELLEGVRNHINTIPRIESHYLRKQTTREYIDGGKTLTDLYNDYKEECIKKEEPFVKIHIYRKIFKEEFNISFFIPKKDQCDLCTSYKNADQTGKNELEEKYQQHLREKEESRKEKTNDKENMNSEKIVACYDLQAVLPVPRGDVSVFYYKSKLNCYNFTISELGTDNTECYFWNEVEGNRGACEIGTCVYKYLVKTTAAASKPIEVIFYSDNCCGQQKNQFIISLYIYALTELQNLKSITHKFLIKGHTQNEGDAAHSTIEKKIKRSLRSGPIYVPDQYVQIIREAKKKGKKFSMNEMSHSEFLDIKSLAGYKFNKNVEGEVVKIGDIKVIKIEKVDGNEFKILYKTSYLDNDFKQINLSQTKTRNIRRGNSRPPQLRRLYSTKLQLTARKKADLKSLVQAHHIPPSYASSFYSTIIN